MKKTNNMTAKENALELVEKYKIPFVSYYNDRTTLNSRFNGLVGVEWKINNDLKLL